MNKIKHDINNYIKNGKILGKYSTNFFDYYIMEIGKRKFCLKLYGDLVKVSNYKKSKKEFDKRCKT